MRKNKLDIQPLLHNGLGRFYLAALLATLYGFDVEAQNLNVAPRLVVNITIDQLRTDYMEYFAPLYGKEGFLRLLNEGRVYEVAEYPFSPVDRASAIACIATGTTPEYNKIIGEQWLSRKTLRPEYCTSDNKNTSSPEKLATSTISDELKLATGGNAIVFSFAQNQDAAILAGGHAANGAFWLDKKTSDWTSSLYYPIESNAWIKAYRSLHKIKKQDIANDIISNAALSCITDNLLGQDDITDYLAITLSASQNGKTGQRKEMQGVYCSLDNTLSNLIAGIESRVGNDKVMFVVTATGNVEEPIADYEKYRIPTGTFFINRTAQLLNMYLSAIYGTGTWVEGYFKNQIYLNHKLIEDQKISYADIIHRSKELLKMTSGVASVNDNPFDKELAGDLWIEVSPGWSILDEDTNTTYQISSTFIPFPVIFLGANIKAEHINSPIRTERIAPTIAKSIQIRAPNACKEKPLF